MTINLTNSNQYTFITLIIFIFFNIYFNCGINSERVGYLYFEFLCYENYEHLDRSGKECDSMPSKNCDPLFTICINHQYINIIDRVNCPIYYTTTISYDNQETVCNKPTDSRGELSKIIVKEMPFIPKEWFIKINVIDSDKWSDPAEIALFGFQFTQSPSPNFSKPMYKRIQMYRQDRRIYNSKVKMSISMSAQCDHNRYGEKCEIFCKPSKFYKCSFEGKKICNEGWKGEFCNQPDLCLYQACVPGGKCIEIDGKAQCSCNGGTGQHCFPNYNPCKVNPCQNEGRCIPNKTGEVGIRCHCNPNFFGAMCELSLCKIVPCHNNATCEYDKDYNRKCICLPGFTGILCDQKSNEPVLTTMNTTFNRGNFSQGAFVDKNIHSGNTKTILFLSFGIFLCILGVIISILLYKKIERKSLRTDNKFQFPMKEMDNKSTPRAISNEYFTKVKDECIYEVVKDENTYSYLQEKNDEYLIPSQPNTPRFPNSPQNNDDSDYLEMSTSFEGNLTLTSNKLYEKEEELPPLPTREIKRKLSLSKFCMS